MQQSTQPHIQRCTDACRSLVIMLLKLKCVFFILLDFHCYYYPWLLLLMRTSYDLRAAPTQQPSGSGKNGNNKITWKINQKKMTITANGHEHQLQSRQQHDWLRWIRTYSLRYDAENVRRQWICVSTGHTCTMLYLAITATAAAARAKTTMVIIITGLAT